MRGAALLLALALVGCAGRAGVELQGPGPIRTRGTSDAQPAAVPPASALTVQIALVVYGENGQPMAGAEVLALCSEYRSGCTVSAEGICSFRAPACVVDRAEWYLSRGAGLVLVEPARVTPVAPGVYQATLKNRARHEGLFILEGDELRSVVLGDEEGVIARGGSL